MTVKDEEDFKRRVVGRKYDILSDGSNINPVELELRSNGTASGWDAEGTWKVQDKSKIVIKFEGGSTASLDTLAKMLE